jgi:putative flippase GtrA
MGRYRACHGAPHPPPVQSVGVPLAETVRLRLGTTWRILLKELSAFGIVGAVCFAIDILLFQLLYAHVGLGAVTAKCLATLVSMTVAYFAHRYWSFSHRARTGLRREYVLFVVVNGATLLLNVGVVAFVRYPLGQESALVLQMANIVGIGAGTIIRYLAYRRWVFPAHEAVPGAGTAAQTPAGSATTSTA